MLHSRFPGSTLALSEHLTNQTPLHQKDSSRPGALEIPRLGLTKLKRFRVWWPGHALALLAHRREPGRRAGQNSDEEHLRAAAQWLGNAQDATADGGVVGRYRLDRGWTSSYPETTGYIIPTFLSLAESLGGDYLERARRCVEFLLSIQLANGAFPGGEIDANSDQPSPFNSGQILHGLLCWYAHTSDEDVLTAARRAGDWLVSEQDEDGAWRRHWYLGIPTTYSAHLSCWLADLGLGCDADIYRQSATRHLDWTLAHIDPATGWVDNCGFDKEEHAARISTTHTLAYTLAGLLHLGTTLERRDAVAAATRAAAAVAESVEGLGWLPAVLDSDWKGRSEYTCLTGNAQMALLWMALYQRSGEKAWLSPAYHCLDLVKRGQILVSGNLGLRGGVPGSDPIWGWYNGGAVINWAAKFFVDALLMKQHLA